MNQMAPQKSSPIVQLRKDLKAALPTFGLPDQKSQDRMSSVLMVAVERTPELLFADRQSLIAATRQCANHGLVPDGNEATLQIYNTKVKVDGVDKWIQKVQYQPMVRGIVNRVLRSGKVEAFWAEVVYQGEEFSIDISHGDRRPVHNPDYFAREGDIIGAYAVAKLTNGSIDCEPMPRSEIDKVRNVAKTQKVWDGWFSEKAKVAVIRRMSKRLPLSAEDMDFIINRDEHDFDRSEPKDVTPKAADTQNLAQKLLGGTEPEDKDADQETIEGTAAEFDPDSVDPFTDEYSAGVQALKDGNGENSNPFEPDSFEFNNWVGGHRFGARAMEGQEQTS